jgi:hypothetical protein
MTKKPPEPWSSFEADNADTAAIQALAAGVANEGQQKYALSLIINRICGTYDMSFRPGDEHATSFAEGKRHVGNQIVRLTKIAVKPKA